MEREYIAEAKDSVQSVSAFVLEGLMAQKVKWTLC